MRRSILLGSLLCLACGVPERDGVDGLSTSAGLDDGGTGDEDEGDDDGDIKLDVDDGMGSADDGGGEQGCRGIDFLFVVDNSGSMSDEQQNLTASFPGFVDAMQEKVAELEAGDFHIMIADTDAIDVPAPGPYCSLTCEDPTDTCYADGGSAMVPCAFSSEQGCYAACAADLDNSCAAGSCRELLNCEGCNCELGAGRIDDQDGNPCNVDGGRRYIQDGQTDLGGTFACLAEVGAQGDGNERAAGATVEALSSDFLAQDGCNEGFVRDDAILVVTVITDEEDKEGEGSAGDPPDWFEAVVAAKNGDPEAVVALGLLGDAGQPNAKCIDDGGEAGVYSPRLYEFIESFPRHVTGSVCEPNYANFFEQAVDLIKDTCEGYVPPG